MMCTPTATPPAWLTCAHPETLNVNPAGIRTHHGIRRHYCSSSPTFRFYTRRIVEKMIEELKGLENIVAWQIDNEPDYCEYNYCHCDSCQEAFRNWLRDRYGSVEGLNKSWKTGFWSMDYSDWSEVRLAVPNEHQYSSRKLDSQRFASHILSDYVLQQARQIRREIPGTVITTNFNGCMFTWLDYYKIFAEMDVACKDLYFDIGTMDVNVLSMNQFRSFKPGKAYWIAETGSGALDFARPPQKDQLKAWMWSCFAHGSEAHMMFRWRTCLSGQEQELQGIIEHSGYSGQRYQAVKEIFLDMSTFCEEQGDLPLPQAETAIVHDYNVQWGYASSSVGGFMNYEEIFGRLHKELYDRNVLADIVPTDRDLSAYKLLIIPSFMMVDEDLVQRLKNFAEEGGVVLVVGQFGLRDENCNYFENGTPEAVRELLGVNIHGGMYLTSRIEADESMLGWAEKKCRDVEISLNGTLNGKVRKWLADMEYTGAETLASVAEDTYVGQPAIAVNAIGSGRVMYVATIPGEELAKAVFDYSLNMAGIGSGVNTPEYVETVQRGNLLFVINHRNEPVDVACPGRVIRGESVDGIVKLPPFGVAVIECEGEA